ncbi:hypothetical protein AN639_08600 [Candidatus Epulonipiscium fishelsonii]|uniref:Uncharacterized protein n=1 Tax=Candidatus Epulonipiscium fishelsonii TaxID=77094 RepID=A0ACC8X9N8_9FIRM|nr:hypothetical protein AN639_08600 [Epulopiscium sp. SCG-B05WGA-EpuloA1]ONI38796.1 hypothetical protein AN396_09940 [Epulopiscium sp. SCG-B11WGA-EpuloA1]ONI47015.1 hypothetical protein AN644_01965 [Epulopiscium sp. SCG-C06WGA-EpuloA1]
MIKTIADMSDMLESEVIDALKYWCEKKVIEFDILSDKSFVVGLNFEDPSIQSPIEILDTKKEADTFNYTQTEFIENSKDTKLIQLCRLTENCLGRTLSWKDQQIIFGLYDNTKLPIEVIEYLLEHCMQKNISNIVSIERMGIDWAEKNIINLDMAKEYVTSKDYFTILNALGMRGVSLTSTHKEFINKWLDVYNLSMEIILEGCKRTVAQINSPTLKYLDKILTEWHKQQIKNIEDIEKLDKKHEQNQKLKFQPKNELKIPAKSKKHFEIPSHNWNFDVINALEKKYNEETEW